MYFVAIAISVVSLACWIMVLIKVFQSGKTLMGVLSICPLFCFIYGWIKVKELGVKNIMLGWSACVVLNIILQIVLAPH